MPKVKEVFLGLKIDLAKGECLSFRSLKTHSIGQCVAEYILTWPVEDPATRGRYRFCKVK